MKQRHWLFWLTVGMGTFIFGYSVSNAVQLIYEKISRATAVVAFDKKIESLETNIKPNTTLITDGVPSFPESTENEFEPSGEYYIPDDLPSGFKDFDYLSLSVRNYDEASEANDFKGVSIPPEGFLLTKKKYRFERVAVSQTEFTFETVSINGIKYKFIGNFLGEPTGEENSYEFIFIKGVLTKYKNGKKQSEATVGFKIMHGC